MSARCPGCRSCIVFRWAMTLEWRTHWRELVEAESVRAALAMGVRIRAAEGRRAS